MDTPRENLEDEKSEDQNSEDDTSASKAAKPDPARYGDWTVKGIAVDF
jgi:hypothetical protein